MLLWSMPNLEPENRTFREWFYSRWGRENCIIMGRATHAEYERFAQRLSIKMAIGGAERYFLDERTVAVDDDHYLILNDGRAYGSLIDSARPMESFSIFFRPGLAQEVLGANLTPVPRWLEGSAQARAVEFHERLLPHDAHVTPVLRFILHHMHTGLDDEAWYEEQLHFLLDRMLVQQERLRAQALSLRGLRLATRLEIDRRLALAADFMNCCYGNDVRLRQIAHHACLSPHHFLRLFRERYRLTPFQYLNRRRIQVARRLLREGELSATEIAVAVGFNSRATFYRQLKKWSSHTEQRCST